MAASDPDDTSDDWSSLNIPNGMTTLPTDDDETWTPLISRTPTKPEPEAPSPRGHAPDVLTSAGINNRDRIADDDDVSLLDVTSSDGPAVQRLDDGRLAFGVHGDMCHAKPHGIDKMARNQLVIVSVLCLVFMVGEITGGVLSNSLALLTDASHMASDLASFIVSLCALWLATKRPTPRLTFGYHRTEVLGALASILIIWIVTGVLVYLGYKRMIDLDHYTIKPDEMLITAGLGVAFNVIMALVLHGGCYKKCRLPSTLGHGHSHGHHHGNGGDQDDELLGCHDDDDDDDDQALERELSDLAQTDADIEMAPHETAGSSSRKTKRTYQSNINIKAAIIHVIGDLIQSVGVLVAAVLIKIDVSLYSASRTNGVNFIRLAFQDQKYKMADPICTFVFSVLVLFTTVTVLRDVMQIFMEAAPKSINREELTRCLSNLRGVRSVHSLNIWSLTAGKPAVSVHLAVENGADRQNILVTAGQLLRDAHHVTHSTIQIEDFVDEMSTCCECVAE